MGKQIQMRGGGTPWSSTFTGAPREVSVDTGLKALRIHDGVTPGGAVHYPASAYMATLFNASSAAALKTLLSLTVGTDVQAFSAVLTALGGLSIVAGDIIYGTGAGTVARLPKQTDGQFLTLASGLPAWAAVGNAREPDFWARDEKTSGTAAGTSASNAFVTRVLNTSKRNVIAGASLASNQMTLPAGTYYARWHAPASNILNGAGVASQSRLQNITDGTTIELSHANSSFVPSASYALPVDTSGEARFVLAATKVVELQHWVSSGALYGRPATAPGTTEVYADIELYKVA